MKAIITTKVKGFTGTSACVAFADGKAEAEISKSQLDYFKAAGYEVKVIDAKPKTDTKKDETKK
jgi:hypothetical protein